MTKRILDLVEQSAQIGTVILARHPMPQRKEFGQFLTPPAVARFMAQQLGPIRTGDRILEPAIGSGTLACAVIERLLAERSAAEVWIEGYEVNPELAQAAQGALQAAAQRAGMQGIVVHVRIQTADFILTRVAASQPTLFSASAPGDPPWDDGYNLVIANPPYFKLRAGDARMAAASGQLAGHTNMYTLFMALSLKLLAPNGLACFVVPRSFCSGAYFAEFRRDFLQQAWPVALHLFDARDDAFESDDVLQENVIIAFRRRPQRTRLIGSNWSLRLSATHNTNGLTTDLVERQLPGRFFVSERRQKLFFRVPTGELDEMILESMDRWPDSLHQFGWQVSTGPIVAFRAASFLTDASAVDHDNGAPLLWMQNVKRQRVVWPLPNGAKPQAIRLAAGSRALLTPLANYVVLRRFSAKEDARRLVAAPLLASGWSVPWLGLGLENHLNYIYSLSNALTAEEAIGLSAVLNCSVLDRYVRVVNGNTQVNAEEIRALPLPPLAIIRQIGMRMAGEDGRADADIDALVTTILQAEGLLPPEFPIIRETRYTMGKIQQAQEVLKAMGLPPAQQNEMAALTLLCLAALTEKSAWRDAEAARLRIHDILLCINQNYGREYAENTRETVRRQVIHQFEQAGLVARNPDDASLPTNSPLTHYALTDAALAAVRTYPTEQWPAALQSFLDTRDSLQLLYQKRREQTKIPVRLSSGALYELSPGAHNRLQAAILREFASYFAPDASLLYVGDTADKSLLFDATAFQKLGVSLTVHGKLPDIVLFDATGNRLFLIEAVVSHGPVSPKRQAELEQLLQDCTARRVYVSAFADRASFKQFVGEIAWETEVWLAETPDHLIHFDGGRFVSLHGD